MKKRPTKSLKYRNEGFFELRLTNAASKRKWICVERLLRVSINFQLSSKCCVDCTHFHNSLHLILRYNPPLDIVRLIVEKDCESVFELDCNDHFPLQTALSYGTSSNVIKYLISKNREAFFTLDVDGKNPMHLAVEGYEILSADTSSKLTSFDTISEIIEILCDVEPSCMLQRDNNNMNAIAYASSRKVDERVISKMWEMERNRIKMKKDKSRSRSSLHDMKKSKTSKSSRVIPSQKMGKDVSNSTRWKKSWTPTWLNKKHGEQNRSSLNQNVIINAKMQQN